MIAFALHKGFHDGGGTAVERAEIDAVTCGNSIVSFCRRRYHHSISLGHSIHEVSCLEHFEDNFITVNNTISQKFG